MLSKLQTMETIGKKSKRMLKLFSWIFYRKSKHLIHILTISRWIKVQTQGSMPMSILKHTLPYAWESCVAWSLSNSHYMLLEVCSIKESYDKTFHTNYYLHCPLFCLLCKYGPIRAHLMTLRCPHPSPASHQWSLRNPGGREVIIPNQVHKRVLKESQAARAVRPGFETQVWHPLDTAIWTNASPDKRLCLLVNGEYEVDLTVHSLDERLPSNHWEQQMYQLLFSLLW